MRLRDLFWCRECGGFLIWHRWACWVTETATSRVEREAWLKVELEIDEAVDSYAIIMGHELEPRPRDTAKLRAAIREWGYAYHLDRFAAKDTYTHAVDRHNAERP